MRSFAAAFISSRVVFMVPADSTSASVVRILFSTTAPEVSMWFTCTVHPPSLARSMSVTSCCVATVTRPVASASAM